MKEPRESHQKAAKHIIYYLNGTYHFDIKYSKCFDLLVNYTNSNWEGNGEYQKSIFGFFFHFSFGPLVWSSKKQKFFALSTTKAEYCGVVNAEIEVVWIQQLLGELGLPVKALTFLHYDNPSSIQVVDNPIAHIKMKLVELHFHHLRQLVKDNFVTFVYCILR